MTVPAIRARKGGDKLVAVTAYDAPTARLADEAGVDIVLVGDSVATAMLGYETTLPVTMEEMLHHVRAARRGTARALLVADMPFLSYQAGMDEAVRNAGAFLKVGADAVKLEGAGGTAEVVAKLSSVGIPVMGHVGLEPQRVRDYGGYRAQGRDARSAFAILRGARALEKAGAFSVVLECVPAALASMVTSACAVPTIGIGAGPECDGQVLVFHDLVGLTPDPPRFARAFADGRKVFGEALRAYVGEVRKGGFPAAGSAPDLPAGELEELRRMAGSLPDK